MQTFSGKLVRLNVPEWFKDTEFQNWFNSRSGKGLATWQHADAPLKPVSLTKEVCGQLAEMLGVDVIFADVILEPSSAGLMGALDGQRAQDAKEALRAVHSGLIGVGDKLGLEPIEAKKLAELLREKVIYADALFYPQRNGTAEAYEVDMGRLEQAKGALDATYDTLMGCFNQSESCDLHAYADFFVGVDPSFNGEGTDSDMPERFWDVIVDAARTAPGKNIDNLHVLVWVSPVE